MFNPVILSVNAGSSSIKYSLYEKNLSDSVQLVASASVSGLTAPPAQFSYSLFDPLSTKETESSKVGDVPVSNHQEAFNYFIDFLTSGKGRKEEKQVLDLKQVKFVCHRIVHGGREPKPLIITEGELHRLDALGDLAPLHNYAALLIVRICMKQLEGVQNVAFFDSSFHMTIGKKRWMYPIDPKVAESKGLRKYGFHGLSYAYIIRAPVKETSIIALHLGSGASVCAIKNGESVDTSMGLTPLEGLPGATRSGSIDPSLIFHYTSEADRISSSSTSKMHITTAEEILNKKSGWKALTGTTDLGLVTKRAAQGDEMAQLAIDIMVDRVVGYIGNYWVKLGGQLDALVFAGGIGERGEEFREAVCEQVSCLGLEMDKIKNGRVSESDDDVIDISAGGTLKTIVVKTDEQIEMAQECIQMKEIWGH